MIINSNKPNNQTVNLPKSEIGNGNDPKNVWSYNHKQQLCRQFDGLSGRQLGIVVQKLKVSCSYIIELIQFKLVSVIF